MAISDISNNNIMIAREVVKTAVRTLSNNISTDRNRYNAKQTEIANRNV